MNEAPILHLEERDGETVIRVEEHRFDAGGYTRTVVDETVVDIPNQHAFLNDLPADESILYENNRVDGAKFGVTIDGANSVAVYDFTYRDVQTSKYGGAFYLTRSDELHDMAAPAMFQRVFADGERRPLNFEGGYRVSNTDFINNDHGDTADAEAQPVFIRDFTALNFSDSIIDGKGAVYVMNGTLENAYRVLRVWRGDEIVIVNSDIRLGEGSELAWFAHNGGRIKYYNTLWNGQPDPDPSLIGIASIPDGMTREEVLAQVLVPLDSNPLPGISDFFWTRGGQLHAEISVDGGAWTEVALDPERFTAEGIVGDPVLALSDLGEGLEAGSYLVRTWFTDGQGGTSPKSESVTFALAGAPVVETEADVGLSVEADVDVGSKAGNLVPVESALPVVDFTERGIGGVKRQDWRTESLEVDENSISIAGNTWKSIWLPYWVTADTVLSFEFRAGVEGEVQGIGFEDNRMLTQSLHFNLFGTEDWGVQDYRYEGDGDWQTFTIEVGAHFTGKMKHLLFSNDNDGGLADVEGAFRNVRVYEGDEGGALDASFVSEPGADDIFLVEALPAPGSTYQVLGFEAEHDTLDLSALLDDYDPSTDVPGDFVALSDRGGEILVSIDPDGGGDSFVPVAVVDPVDSFSLADVALS